MIVILFVSVASGQSVEILFVFKSPFWTKKYKNVEFYRLKSLHFRYISKISKFRTKISDLGNFLYGICRFYAIYTKTTLTLQVQTKLSRKRELLGLQGDRRIFLRSFHYIFGSIGVIKSLKQVKYSTIYSDNRKML